MVKICYCGDTIKRPINDSNYCSGFCKSYASSGKSWSMIRAGHTESLKCDWCGTNYPVGFGQRNDKIFCSYDCSFEAQAGKNWLQFNYCRVLSRNPEGLGVREIARLLDEYGFQQAPRTVTAKIKKLVARGVIFRKEGSYTLNHPNACGKLWLSCL